MAWVAVLAASACHAESSRVARVVDGDTLEVQTAAGTEAVRLIGIDTPERHHPKRPPEYGADEATAFVERLIDGKRVRLERDPETDDRDAYGRLLRYVYLPDDRMLNELLIRAGHAYAYTRFPFTKSERFKAIEAEARRNAVGLWSGSGLDEVRWLLEQGSARFTVYPTTNRTWAIEYEGYIKTRVPSNQLLRQLNRLLEWIAEHGVGDALMAKLAEDGYARLDRDSN